MKTFTLTDAFVRLLGDLLEFHKEDDSVGQGQFADPVESWVATDAGDVLIVRLESGRRLRVVVSEMPDRR